MDAFTAGAFVVAITLIYRLVIVALCCAVR
jgi:hypothetical protein